MNGLNPATLCRTEDFQFDCQVTAQTTSSELMNPASQHVSLPHATVRSANAFFRNMFWHAFAQLMEALNLSPCRCTARPQNCLDFSQRHAGFDLGRRVRINGWVG
jgi:hypothetical protein